MVQSAPAYGRVFASYSHEDTAVVEAMEAFVQTLGLRYLRDVRDLRSGEVWTTALERLITEADVFQLFWSTRSMRSPHVRREWEFALGLGRPSFVRPVYWEVPMPEDKAGALPPDTLRAAHFARLPTGATAAVDHGVPVPSPPLDASARPWTAAAAFLTTVAASAFAIAKAGVVPVLLFGVLAGIAAPNFISMQLKAKRAEVPGNLDGIKTAELSYDAAFDTFVACERSPRVVPDRSAVPWTDRGGFGDLGWAPDGAVRGVYDVRVDTSGGDPQFFATGLADVDGDGKQARWGASVTANATLETGNDVY